MPIDPKRRITQLQFSRGSGRLIARGLQPGGALGRNTPIGGAFGQNTQRFFIEGEQHEATDWRDTVLPPDDEPEVRVRSGSFDKVPRQPGAMAALAIFGILFLAGVGFGVGALMRTGWSVSTSVAQFFGSGAQAGQPASVPPITPPGNPTAPTPGTPVATTPAATTPPDNPATSPVVGPPPDGAAELDGAAKPLAAATAPAPAGDLAPAAAPVPGPRRAAARAHDQATHQARRTAIVRRPAARPSRPAPADDFPLDSVLDHASAPSTTGALSPPRLAEPEIAPPSTGAPAPEKAPPKIDQPDDSPAKAEPPAQRPAPAGSEEDPFEPR